MRRIVLALFTMTLAFTLVKASATGARKGQDAGSGAVRPANNPIPDRFVNLSVLPKDITKAQLVNVMKQFSVTFNVRCSYCHTVSDDLTQGSFDSDAKDTKGKARELLKSIYQVKSPGLGKRN